MQKYIIDVDLKDDTGFEVKRTITELSYHDLLEVYALINALEFEHQSIQVHPANSHLSKISIQDFIILNLASKASRIDM